MIRRKRIGPKPPPYPKHRPLVDNRSTKNWDQDYELVVTFRYGLDEEVIQNIAGLRNYDTEITMNGKHAGVRDLMFPCGTNKALAVGAANRLWRADCFGALRICIRHPVEHEGKDSFTPWYDRSGKLLERVKHRQLVPELIKNSFKRHKDRVRKRAGTYKRHARKPRKRVAGGNG